MVFCCGFGVVLIWFLLYCFAYNLGLVLGWLGVVMAAACGCFAAWLRLVLVALASALGKVAVVCRFCSAYVYLRTGCLSWHFLGGRTSNKRAGEGDG